MAIRYNDPSLGQAFENIAGLFAPMSGNDLAAYASADQARGKAAGEMQRQGLIDMFAQSGDDRMGVAAGLYNPSQSYQAVDMSNATARRGQDIASGDSRYGSNLKYASDIYGHDRSLEGTKYTSDNTLRGSVFDSVSKPLGQGEVRQVPDAIVEWATGIPGAGLDQAGAPKPLTEEQVRGGMLEQAALDDPAFANWILGGSKDPVEAVDAEGNAVLARPHDAAGMGIYEKPSADSVKMTNARLPNGEQIVALQTASGLIDPQTKQPLPTGTTMFSTSATGSAEAVGLGKTLTGKLNEELLNNTSTQDTGQRLIELVSQNPASQGAVGWLRGTAQDAIQTGGEIGSFFGGEVQKITNEVAGGLADASLTQPGGAFDPTLPAIDMLMNLYVYNYAKSITGERLSNEAVKQWRGSLGLDNMLGNQANTLARITEAQSALQRRESRIRDSMGAGAIPPANAQPQTGAPTLQVGTVEDGFRYVGGDPKKPESWEAVQ